MYTQSTIDTSAERQEGKKRKKGPRETRPRQMETIATSSLPLLIPKEEFTQRGPLFWAVSLELAICSLCGK